MPGENQIQNPAAKVTVVNPPALPFTPSAVRLGVKSRSTTEKLLADLAPLGNPDPILLATAKTAIKQLMEQKFPNAAGFDVLIETNAAAAAQIMVIVTPHDL